MVLKPDVLEYPSYLPVGISVQLLADDDEELLGWKEAQPFGNMSLIEAIVEITSLSMEIAGKLCFHFFYRTAESIKLFLESNLQRARLSTNLAVMIIMGNGSFNRIAKNHNKARRR